MPSTAGSDAGLRATIDPTLLDVLPLAVAGLSVLEWPAAEQQAVRNADLGRNVARVVTAFVGDAAGTNWAFSSVAAPRPGAATVDFLRDWRATFDAGACERAGGVGGQSTISVGGREVNVASCNGGVTTYHVWLARRGLLISISSFGDARFGLQLLDGLRL